MISDYAHHPREIQAAVDSARQAYPESAITAVFQPHLFSRTRLFTHEYAEALAGLDRVVVLPVYPAREKPIPGVTSEMIEKDAIKNGYDNIRYIGAKENCLNEIAKISKAGDMIITMGAGTITLMAPALLERLSE